MDLLLDYTLEIMVKGQKNAWVEGYFWPSRPAPVCSNPNSPAFSNDGDPAEVEIVGVLSEAAAEEWNPVYDEDEED